MLTTRFKNIVGSYCALSLAVATLALPISDLQAQAVQDIDPPVIQHVDVSEGVAGEIQSFDVVVYDDAEVVSVSFLHRQTGETSFKKLEMVFLEKDDYRVFLPTAADKAVTIEYYIEAVDIGDNKTLVGFPEPFERKIIVPVEAAPKMEAVPNLTQTPNTPSPSKDEVSDDLVAAGNSVEVVPNSNAIQGEKKNNLVWMILGGAAAVGVLVALGGDDEPSPPTDAAQTITFTLVPPSSQ